MFVGIVYFLLPSFFSLPFFSDEVLVMSYNNNNQGGGGFRPPPRPKNAMDNTNFGLSAPCPTADGKYSNFKVIVVNGNPRIQVYTGDPNDRTDNGRIETRAHPMLLGAFAELIRTVSANPNPCKYGMAIDNFDPQQGRPSKTHRLIVGRDKDGVIYVSLIDIRYDSRPRVQFKLDTPRWVVLEGEDGQPLNRGEASAIAARAYANTLEKFAALIADRTYKHPEPKNKGGNNNRGGGGGGYQGGGNNQGGANQNSGGGGSYDSYQGDNDIPY